MGLRLILMGAPGAGKGTQAARIAETREIPHISTGDIFRQHIEEETELGKQVKAYMDEGHLVPDGLTCTLVEDRLRRPDCASGYVLDGFPRTLAQAECLDEMLSKRSQHIDLVINIEVKDEEIVRRLAARRVCSECGAIYNVLFEPPPKAKICGHCGAELIQRSDDQEDTVRERLRVYHGTSEPILDYYRACGKLKNVPGMGMSPDGVFAKIEALIDSTNMAYSQ